MLTEYLADHSGQAWLDATTRAGLAARGLRSRAQVDRAVEELFDAGRLRVRSLGRIHLQLIDPPPVPVHTFGVDVPDRLRRGSGRPGQRHRFPRR